jgi:hypothetical protein
MAQSSTSSRDEIITAITDFYKFYIRLPYLDSNALVFAPENDGWPNVRGGWTIDDGSDCIQYHKGACYNNNPELIKSLPAHIIPIANPTDREGRYLLLDIQTGNVTSYNVLANNIEGKWEAYERLGDNDKWKAFPTAPIGQFFGRWQKLYEKLIWMVAPAIDDSHGDGGTYFTRADNSVEENEMLENDDDGDIEIDDEVTKVWFSLNFVKKVGLSLLTCCIGGLRDLQAERVAG